MSRIVIVGGHGKIALLASPLLVAAGHEVTSLIRNPEHANDVNQTGATAVVADVEHLDTHQIAHHYIDQDIVIWSAGAGGGNPSRTYAVDRDSAIRSMDAANESQVGRYIMVSYKGSRPDHGVPADNSFFAYAEAKNEADMYLRNSTLNWTILGPSRLLNEPATGLIDVNSDRPDGTVSRADVAAVIAHVVDNPTISRRTIGFDSGTTAITDALALL